MAEQWISTRRAYEIVGDEQALLTRLKTGMIQARAELLRAEDGELPNVPIGEKFWDFDRYSDWRCDWDNGDFFHSIGSIDDVHAMGVRLALSGILEMVPFENRGLLARSFSIAGNSDWITAAEARRLIYSYPQYNLASSEVIIEQARLGFVVARAVLAQCDKSEILDDWAWEEREWDVPVWFWTDFTSANSSAQDWKLGRFSGKGVSPHGLCSITLSGLHFHRPTLEAFFRPENPQKADANSPEQDGRRGRRPAYDWARATSTVWGRLYRGELVAKVQADIEQALIASRRSAMMPPAKAR